MSITALDSRVEFQARAPGVAGARLELSEQRMADTGGPLLQRRRT